MTPTNQPNPANPHPNQLLTIDQLATQLATTERFIRRLIHQRRIPHHKIGKYIRFHPDDIETWINHQRINENT